MGCWGIGSFDNDTAADWVCDLTEAGDLSLVREAIAAVLATDSDVDSTDATTALAAIEVIVAALGRPTAEALDEPDVVEWIDRVKPLPDAQLTSDAAQAIDRILGPTSELRELWEDTDDFNEWQAEVRGLRSRLQI
ncbi:DUF4259 domain-containing protein [Xanthomonas nasturtii]|uniref:DUF4259 domain-containing protein n=1 Tax=Xanthomonas dyei TaxID=743699 RepID=A0A2S7C541_9XANT|nr:MULTISPECIES: DUF4259 domain-containing protein [Xanthomonas]MEA9554841.1 DUF4259 domain-containing protein [Xanthomonas nasturtii]PPU56673.1 hypothetical protein XdyCFBP7245_08275 [Xanthomonas dyei]